MTRPAGLAVAQLRYEQKVFWRNIGAAFFTFAFPVLLLVLFGALLGSHGETAPGGTPGIQYYTPAIAACGVMSACFVSIALTVTFRRETGLLKKVRGTPLPPLSYFSGLAASAVINATVIVTLIITVGAASYGATMPRDRAAPIITLLARTAAFCTLALAVTTFNPNLDAAPAVVNLISLALLVISGGFTPLASPSVLSQIAQIFPPRHLLLASHATYQTSGPASFPWWHVSVIATWGTPSLATTLRHFRWDTRPD